MKCDSCYKRFSWKTGACAYTMRISEDGTETLLKGSGTKLKPTDMLIHYHKTCYNRTIKNFSQNPERKQHEADD